jgi:hypothetical protein
MEERRKRGRFSDNFGGGLEDADFAVHTSHTAPVRAGVAGGDEHIVVASVPLISSYQGSGFAAPWLADGLFSTIYAVACLVCSYMLFRRRQKPPSHAATIANLERLPTHREQLSGLTAICAAVEGSIRPETQLEDMPFLLENGAGTDYTAPDQRSRALGCLRRAQLLTDDVAEKFEADLRQADLQLVDEETANQWPFRKLAAVQCVLCKLTAVRDKYEDEKALFTPSKALADVSRALRVCSGNIGTELSSTTVTAFSHNMPALPAVAPSTRTRRAELVRALALFDEYNSSGDLNGKPDIIEAAEAWLRDDFECQITALKSQCDNRIQAKLELLAESYQVGTFRLFHEESL